MPRLSIDLSEQQHQHLKVIATLHGQSIKDYVLSRTFGEGEARSDISEEAALKALHSFLEDRLQQVREGKAVERTAEDIKARARQLRDGGV